VLTIPRSVRIFIGSTPIDMRKSIDGPLRVPAHADHGFRSMPITDSGRSRSPIPEQADR
jgi:hypothetical protein